MDPGVYDHVYACFDGYDVVHSILFLRIEVEGPRGVRVSLNML
jgi:hypothetical protein